MGDTVQASHRSVQGPVESTPCAHCGMAQDLRELDAALQRGTCFDCDECGKTNEIVDLRRVAVVRQA